MLARLSIKNYALIKELEFAPSHSLNIITGETGAGKSIMLGAVGLLLGKRADTKVLYDNTQKCVIEGEFDISAYRLNNYFKEEDIDYADLTLIRREITPAGKSRAFINDTPIKLERLRALGEKLMDVHSQHETLLLGSQDYQLAFIDLFAGNTKKLDSYRTQFNSYKLIEKSYNLLVTEAQANNNESDYNRFILNELEESKLEIGEQATLEEELKVLENAELIKTKLSQALSSLDGEDLSANVALQTTSTLIKELGQYGEKFSSLSTRISEVIIELNDISRDLEGENNNIEFDFDRTQTVNDRLALIYKLQQKHKADCIEDLLTLKETLETKVQREDNLDDILKEKKLELETAYSKLEKQAEALSNSRKKVVKLIADQLHQLLTYLGMPDASIEINAIDKEPALDGADNITILFSANKGIRPMPLKQVASGGEFSRLMMCIKYILADKTALPTIIFDEIDTGVSGEIALKLGKMMQKMATNHQVIAISHLPQIAAKGSTHFYVYKENNSDRSESKIKVLSGDDRVEEIAKMISGDQLTDSSYTSAKELMSK